MPHPATSKKQRKEEARANNLIANSYSKSGGKKSSKSKNPNKNSNSQHPYDNRERCLRCKNLGHGAKECKANLSKKCSFCQKFGHIVSECRTASKKGSGQVSESTVANSNPPHFNSPVQTSAGQMYMVDASTYHSFLAQTFANSNSSNVSNSNFGVSGPQTDPKTSIRTVTFPSNIASRANGTG